MLSVSCLKISSLLSNKSFVKKTYIEIALGIFFLLDYSRQDEL
jgi:hypothetical protein